MRFSKRTRRWILWAAVLMALLALRWGWMLYDRSRPVPPKKRASKQLPQDYLVRLPRFHIPDFEGARQLVGKPIWVKKGYQLPYYPVGGRRKSAGGGGAKRLLPLEKLVVKDVVEQSAPGGAGNREVLALFEKEGAAMGTVIGTFDGQRQLYRMVLDHFFYSKDPRELYPHWSENTWRLVENRKLEPDMTFAQVALSIGDGTLVTRRAGDVHVYEFRRKPGGAAGRCRVRFKGGRVAEFKVLD